MRHYILAALSIISTMSALPASASDSPPATRTWLDRPWDVRYVLFAEEAWSLQIEIAVSRRLNAKKQASGQKSFYLSAASLYQPTATLTVPGARPVAVVVLAFDRTGRVLNQQGTLGNMTAKTSLLGNLALIDDESPGSPPYFFADWSQGVPGDVTFSPAVCSSHDIRRYEADWNVNSYTGNFGCREWTAQLYDRDRPYIDVTSWAPRGSFIGELVGWSRFEDPPKPVIGRQGKTWLCLHECPAGEQPGVIPDIKKWTARHGFPMPQRPRKQPLYPDADYHDDLNE